MSLGAIGIGAVAVLVAGVLAVSGVLAGESSGKPACLDELASLTPSGSGPDAYTMGIRVNGPADVDSIRSQIGDRILPRDVFVINTEPGGTRPGQWTETLSSLDDEFGCNRIAVLNGLGTDSGKAGYIKALAGDERVDAVMLDWEADSWEGAGRGRWDPGLERNLSRIEQVSGELSGELHGGQTTMGLVPDYLPPWDYGRTAKLLGWLNWKLDPDFRGFQIVQTQPNCGDPSSPGPLIGPLAQRLRGQYRPLFDQTPAGSGWIKAAQPSEMMLEHLGFEISFSTTPNPGAAEAVDRVGPEQAARCSAQIVGSGGAGILYWADPGSLRAMLETPAGRQIRPPGDS